jgi:hypothetical protein
VTSKPRLTKAEKERRAAMQDEQVRQARKAAKRGRAAQRQAFNARLVDGVDLVGLDAALDRLDAESAPAAPKRRGSSAHAAPSGDPKRWVPIGPSVVRKGQAVDSPRVSGRIRDIGVDDAGRRAYAATAMGGVWYTADGGATWSPFGGWAERARAKGGANNGQSIGCLLVTFGASQVEDIVLAGTGEMIPVEDQTGSKNGGVGVLCSKHPTAGALNPWEVDSGLGVLEGTGIYRLVRKPGTTPGKASGTDADVVLACTSKGAFLGTRTTVSPGGGQPDVEKYEWAPLWTADMVLDKPVTDAVWATSTRLLLAVFGWGPVICNGSGGPSTDVKLTGGSPVRVEGAQSFGRSTVNPNRVYVLGEVPGTPKTPTIWQIEDVTGAVQMTPVPGTPATLWGTQRDYDQAIAVDCIAGVDRIYLGGSTVKPKAGVTYSASLYCFDVKTTPSLSLVPAEGVSRPTWESGAGKGDGADQPGLIGNNVHADVHGIVLTGNDPTRRQVWVATDGGVFVSDRCGRVYTFSSCNTGLAALQPVFVRAHPVNGHMVATGCQDNGTQVRTGDTVWEELFAADGGGLAFVPLAPHLIVRQYNSADWECMTSSAFVDPMQRHPGWPLDQDKIGNEDTFALFYSGAAVIGDPPGPNPTRSRLAIGTTRVWLTDNLTGTAPNTWTTLPWQADTSAQSPTDGRPGGVVPNATQAAFGVPTPGLGVVVTLAWVSISDLLAIYTGGVVRYKETAGKWAVTTLRLTDATCPISRDTTLTDIAPVPDTEDFYLASTGLDGKPAQDTVWFYNSTDSKFYRTGLRRKLDIAGAPPTPGPRDPAFSVVVDPLDTKTVYVGTATGMWKGVRTSQTGAHTWTRFDAGLPQAMVQDLSIWSSPTAGPAGPRLLRAAVQSRGVWEVDLANSAKRITWIRAHRFDNRRMPRANDVDPMLASAPAASFGASPDIVVRPKWPVAHVPRFPGTTLKADNAPAAYDVWTFQTAFRWLYPSVVANGVFTEALGSLVSFHRKAVMGDSADPEIDQDVWEDVVGREGSPAKGVRVSDAGTASHRPSDTNQSLAVYRAPWVTSRVPDLLPSEVDVLELVTPVQKLGDLWTVYREPCSVDVIAHHRDAREVPRGKAWVVLLWAHAPTQAALLAKPGADVLSYLTSMATGSAPAPEPAGWNIAKALGFAKRPINEAFDARLPRGRSVDVDLTPVPAGHHVMLLAFVRSDVDDALEPPSPLDPPGPGLPAKALSTVSELLLTWPHVAARIVKVADRPAP